MKTVKFLIIASLLIFSFFNAQNVLAIASPGSVRAEQTGGNTVYVSWGSVAGATKYTIERQEGSGGWQILPETTLPGYTDTGVSNNIPYTYRVVAVGSTNPITGQIDFSSPVSSNSVTPVAGGGGGGGGGGSGSSGLLLPIIQCGNEPGDMCTLCDIFETISRVINIMLIYGFAIGGGLLVAGGIMMYFGGASPGLLTKAKRLIKDVIIGIVIMLVSYLIVFTIISVLSGGNANKVFNIKNGGFLIECES